MLPSAPPVTAEMWEPVRRGSRGWPAFTVQAALGACGFSLKQDGVFGRRSTRALKDYQRRVGLVVDGVCGPGTSRSLTDAICMFIEDDVAGLPHNLARNMARGEGGDCLWAVNWSVSGGVDCGLWQFRVYGPPYPKRKLKRAFRPHNAGIRAMERFLAARAQFRSRGHNIELAGRLALLSHNWPWGADTWARYGHIPNGDRIAPWVPKGVKFRDGHPVTTYQDWAEYYAMGGRHGDGPLAHGVVW